GTGGRSGRPGSPSWRLRRSGRGPSYVRRLRCPAVRFDLFTIALLTLRDDAPQLDEEVAAALQDAHMAFNADLHDAGHLLAAGPLADLRYRGLSFWSVEPERVRLLREQDPAVRAGRLSGEVLRWMVPNR